MIYLDNAATTKMHTEALAAMMPYLTEEYGNPSAVYTPGWHARNAITTARQQAASLINANENEIHFTSGGTEADNWAVREAARMLKNKGKHIIISAIEHHAVVHSVRHLEQDGFCVSVLPVNKDGFIECSELEKAIRPDTILISIMTANNEIGTIQPVKELAHIAHLHNILFHTDAVQAFGQIPIDVKDWDVDMLSASSHKLYGPKGIGCLYVKSSILLPSLICGGAQEHGMRAGTENVAAIAGFGAACSIAARDMKERIEKETKLRDYFFNRLLTEFPDARINGAVSNRLPGNVNICLNSMHSSKLLILLDMKGICASAGSACNSVSVQPSHVLKAIGLSDEEAHGSLRFTLSYETKKEEVDTVIEALKYCLSQY